MLTDDYIYVFCVTLIDFNKKAIQSLARDYTGARNETFILCAERNQELKSLGKNLVRLICQYV